MKVLLAIDDSQHAERAWQFYVDHIHQEGTEVILCHSIEMSSQYVQAGVGAEVIQQMMQELKRDADKSLNKYTKLCAEKHIASKVVLEVGRPGELLVKTAQKDDVNMVVMGTRGMGAVRRTILGSVSDYVVHHAHCPVLICRH